MGLFGGSKTYVGTSVARVLDENQYPETLRSAVLKAIRRDVSISEQITEDVLNGGGVQIDRMYSYARDHYPYGLPSQNYINTGASAQQAKDYIASLYTGAVAFEYVRLEALDFTHVGWQTLTEDYGYDYASNEIRSLSDQVGKPVYLDNIKAYHYLPPAVEEETDPYLGSVRPSASPSPTRGYTPERRAQDVREIQQQALHSDYVIIDAGEDHVRIFYVYEEGGTLVRDFFEVSLAGYDSDANYYHAMLHETTDTGEYTRFFTYRHGEGTHPTLDALNTADYVTSGRFFPFLFFRKHHMNLASESRQDTDLYRASVKMADYMNLDYQAFSDSIHENPDIDDVRHAVLMMGVPANSDDPVEIQYLFDFFARVHAQDRDGGDTAKTESLTQWATQFKRGKTPVPKAVTIRDAGFKMALGFTEVTRRTRPGKLGKIGTYTRVQGKEAVSRVVNAYDEYGVFQRTVTQTFELPYQRYRKQVTSLSYSEITVYDLTLRYDVYKDYDVVADTFDGKLLIPIDKDITDGYNLLDKEAIYFRSLHMVYNSKVKKKLKWYESSFFKFVMIVVAVVITIYSGGAAAGALAAAAAKGTMALVMAIVQTVVVALAVNYAFKIAVRALGIEAAMALAIVAAGLSLGVRINSVNSFMGISAEKLMVAATGFVKGANAETQRQIGEYSSKNSEFNLMREEQVKELEAANDLLEMDNLIDPFEFIGMEPIAYMGESADDFYNRTVHSGNIGTLAYEHIHNYVDINLQLPDFNKTMGELV